MKIYRLIKNFIYFILGKRTIGARILLIQDNKILLVKHSYQDGWYTIGGAVERGESPLEAIHRELEEEVGVKLHEPPKLFSVYYSNLEKRDDYVMLYIASHFSQADCKSPEIADKKWFSLENLPSEVTPATSRRINEYLNKQPINDRW